MKKSSKLIALILFAFFALATILFYEGHIIQFAWAWFIVPFTGFEPLPLAAAMGISMFLSFMYFAITSGKQLDTVVTEYQRDPIGASMIRFIVIIIAYSGMFGIMALIHLAL